MGPPAPPRGVPPGTLPTATRVVAGGRRRLADALHELGWRIRSRPALERLVEERLQLGADYWLFVLGLNNSGTTLLDRILSSHPAIRGLPREGHLLSRAVTRPKDAGVFRHWAIRLERFRWTEASDPTPALRLKYDWSRYYARRPGILLEKSPPNTVRSRWLQENFRPSRFLAIVRSPYAVCEGIRRRVQQPLEVAAQHWARANQTLFDDLPQLRHQQWMRYEDFCRDPAAHLERIRSFLELETPFDAAALDGLDVHNLEGSVGGVRDFNAKSIARLSAQDIATINAEAGEAMEALGYPRL